MDPVKKEGAEPEEIKKEGEEPEKRDEFEKEEELVSAGKYNAAVRKQRELEEEIRRLKKDGGEPEKREKSDEDEEEEDDDFFDDEDEDDKKKSKKAPSDDPYKKDIEEIKARLSKREAEDRSNERKKFFKTHPEYLNDAEKWQELLDELDSSINPSSKLTYYQQLSKAHVLISAGNTTKKVDPEIEKKKAEMASEAASKGDGSKKTDNNRSALDERSLRLANRMPRGYEIKKPKE